MNIFADFNGRINKIVEALDLKDEDGATLDLSRDQRRAAARRRARRSCRPTPPWCWPSRPARIRARWPSGSPPRCRPIRMSPRPRWPGPASSTCRLGDGYWHAAARRDPRRRRRTTAARRSAAAARSMSNTSRPIRPARCMSAIAAAPWSATRSPTCSPSPATRSPRNTTSTTPARRSTCSARSVLLRYREALGDDDRRDPGRALSRRLSRPGRPGAGRRVRPEPAADAGGRGAGDRQGSHHRRDDGDDPRGSRPAQRPPRGVLLGARRCMPTTARRSARRSPT